MAWDGSAEFDEMLRFSRLKADIKQTPGQGGDISLPQYYVRIGSDDDLHDFVVRAQGVLVGEYPALTPKSLDHLIWRSERDR